jgi:hypothetical protein
MPLNVMQQIKPSEMSPKRAGRLEKHDFESPEGQNHRRQDMIKRESLTTTANETDDQRNKRLKTHRETQQLVRTNVENFDRDLRMTFLLRQFAKFAQNVVI